MLPPFVINLAFFSFIFLMKQILDITDMIVNQKVGAGAVCLLLIYLMPLFLQYVIPMSVMMAVLLSTLRMSGDNEIMALKAGGVNIFYLLPPVLTFGVMGMLITGYMTILGVPQSTDRLKTLLIDVASANLNVSLKERTFNDSFKNIMLYVNRIDPQSKDLYHVLIEDRRTKGVNNTVIAKRGKLFGDPKEMVYHLRLYGGTINQMNMQDRSSHTINFETYDIRLDLRDVINAPGLANKRPKEMTLTELRNYLKKVKDNKNAYYDGLLNLHKKFSIPVACLAMGLLALPLGIQSRNAKKAFGVGMGLLFFLIYYLLLSTGSALAENGRLHPAIGMWIPNVILGGLGIILLVRSAQEKTISLTFLAPVMDTAMRLVKKR
jgi:lipopolysaccharide export system permease protein